jgi:hypothetical protein
MLSRTDNSLNAAINFVLNRDELGRNAARGSEGSLHQLPPSTGEFTGSMPTRDQRGSTMKGAKASLARLLK